MTTSFNPNLSNDISKVRQLIGDTDITKALVQDETITAYLLTLSVLRTGARLAYDLSAQYARSAASFTVDNQRNDASKISGAYKDLGDRLTAEASVEENVAGNSAASAGMVIVTGLNDCRGPLDDCQPSSRLC